MKTENAAYSTWFTLPGQNVSNKGKSFAWTRNGGSVGYMELRANYSYEAGEAVTYDAYLVLSGKPDTAALDTFLNAYKAAGAPETLTVSGSIANGEFLAGKSAVILERDGAPYGWRMVENGRFSFEAPKGEHEYKVYLESDGLARGEALKVPDSGGTLNLPLGKAKDALTINLADQNGEAVWGKVEVLGEYPVVRFTGDSVFQAAEKGVIKALVNDLVLYKDETLVLDMEAGIEHLGRGTAMGVDVMVIVVDSGQRALDCAHLILRMAREIGLERFMIVGNKVTGETDRQYIAGAFPDMEITAFLSYSEGIRAADRNGLSALSGMGPGERAVIERIIESI
jgi:hypothetical protein